MQPKLQILTSSRSLRSDLGGNSLSFQALHTRRASAARLLSLVGVSAQPLCFARQPLPNVVVTRHSAQSLEFTHQGDAMRKRLMVGLGLVGLLFAVFIGFQLFRSDDSMEPEINKIRLEMRRHEV